MKKHTKIYLNYLNLDETDFIPSEISGQKAVDIHHIIGRGKCGEDRIENLMALTREEHLKYGDKKEFMSFLLLMHLRHLELMNVNYNKQYLEDKIYEYS